MKNTLKSRKYIDMKGQKIHDWTVLEVDIERSENKNWNPTYWICECICGKIKSFSGKWLRNDMKKGNCGCVRKSSVEYKQNKRIKNIWTLMIARCYDPKHNEYFRYGDGKVIVCDRWLNSFENFYEDMFPSYVEFESKSGINSATIDRIDSTGNYEPSNCRWLTLQQQARNRKDSLPSTVRGKDYGTVMELVEDYPHLPYGVVQSRYHKGLRGEDLIAPYYGIQKPFSETRK